MGRSPRLSVPHRCDENGSAQASSRSSQLLTWPSGAPGAMRKNPALKSGSFRFARQVIVGSPKPNAQNSGLFIIPASMPARPYGYFRFSNWTEADIWQYIRQENIPIVPLYFAAKRPVVRRYGQWILVIDNRFPLEPGETPEIRMIRFRTLGCYPLTAGIESNATTLDQIRGRNSGDDHLRATRTEDHRPQQEPVPWNARSRKGIFDGFLRVSCGSPRRH